MIFNIKEYQSRPSKLHHRLTWAMLIAKGVVLNKTGSFQKTIEFRGTDLFSAVESENDAISAQVNNALKRLGSNWAFFCEAQRRKVSQYPFSIMASKASQLIENERKELFEAGNNFESKYYLTFSFIPPRENQNKFLSKFSNTPEGINYSRFLEYFQAETSKIIDILKTVFPFVHALNDDETLTYLHSTISTKRHKIRTPQSPIYLDYLLADETLQGGLNPMLGEKHLAIISIKGFPHESYPQILNELNQIPCQYRWVTRFISLDKMDAVKELKRYSRAWFSKRKSIWNVAKEALLNESDSRENADALNKTAECEAMLEVVQSGLVSAGYYTACLVLWDKDITALNEKAKRIEQIINSAGFVTVRESFNAIQAWLSTLPCNCLANVRRPLIHSLNLAHLLPISSDWSGNEINEHLKAPCLFTAKAAGNTPFKFSNHVGDVGHTMIIGATGTGKSVLLSFIASQFQRYPKAQVFFFDKDYSAKCITKAVDGNHFDLGSGKAFFQPLKDIQDQSAKAWAYEWILNILDAENVELTPERKGRVQTAFEQGLSCLKKNELVLSNIEKIIKDFEIINALKPYQSLFGASSDKLNLSAFNCFELGSLIADRPRLIVPTLQYLFNRIEKKLKGNPSLIILDEAWLFLSIPTFANKIKDWLKTLRKKNTSVIFASQSLADISESNIISTLIESCPTRIFLPNKKAQEPHIKSQYEAFGLNDRQIEIITTALPKKEYYCQSDQGNRLFELELGKIALTLCGSSSQADLKLIDSIKSDFLNDFLMEKGIYAN